MQLYLGTQEIGEFVVYKDGNLPGFLETESGDIAFFTPEYLLDDTRSPLTATAKQDLRLGTVAFTNEGIVKGEKNFPSYETSKGATLIMPGRELKIYLSTDDKYDYTSLQAIICLFNTTYEDSVAAEKVVIEDGVYQVSSIDKKSDVIKDDIEKSINFCDLNDFDVPLLIRYYTYKEID